MKNQKLQNRLLSFSIGLSLFGSIVAQDIMTLQNGDVKSVKVTEINNVEIKYKFRRPHSCYL